MDVIITPRFEPTKHSNLIGHQLTKTEPFFGILPKVLLDGLDGLADGQESADAHQHRRFPGGLRTQDPGVISFAVVEGRPEIFWDVMAGWRLVFLETILSNLFLLDILKNFI